MESRKLTPRHAAIAYFACFAVGWVSLAAVLLAGAAPDTAADSLRIGSDAGNPAALMLLLAAHAAAVAVVAWKAPRWLFAHGALALVLAGLPVIALVRQLWLVPVFFSLIAELYVWMAARHESPGRLQATPRRSTEPGPV
jgi:hypothetical protein